MKQKADTGLALFKKALTDMVPNHFLSDEEIERQKNRGLIIKPTPNTARDEQRASEQRYIKQQQLIGTINKQIMSNPDNPLSDPEFNPDDVYRPSWSLSDRERYQRAKSLRADIARLDNSEQGFLDFFHRNKMMEEFPTILSTKESAELAKKEGVDLKWDKPVTEGEVRFAIERNKLRAMMQNELDYVQEGESFTAMQNLCLWGSSISGSMPASELATTVGLSVFMPEVLIGAVARLGVAGVDVQRAARVALAAKKAQEASNKYMNSMKIVDDMLKTAGKAKTARALEKETKLALRTATTDLMKKSGFSEAEAISAGRTAKSSQKAINSILSASGDFTDKQRTAYNLVQLFKGGEQLGETAQFGLGSKMLMSATDNVITSIPFMTSSYLNSERNKTDSYSYADILAESLFAGVIGAGIPLAGLGIKKAWGKGKDIVSDILHKVDDTKTKAKIDEVLTGTKDLNVVEAGENLQTNLNKMAEGTNNVPASVTKAGQDILDAPLVQGEQETLLSYVAKCIMESRIPRLEELPLKTPILTQLKSTARAFIEGADSTKLDAMNDDVISHLEMEPQKDNVIRSFSSHFRDERGILGRLNALGLDQLEANATLVDIYKYNLYHDADAFNRVTTRLQGYEEATDILREAAINIGNNTSTNQSLKESLINAIGTAKYGDKWKAIQSKLKSNDISKVLTGDTPSLGSDTLLTEEEETLRKIVQDKVDKDFGKLFKKDSAQKLQYLEKLTDDLDNIKNQNALLMDTDNILDQQYDNVQDMAKDILNPTYKKGLLSDLISLPDISMEGFKEKVAAVEEKRSLVTAAQNELNTTIENLKNVSEKGKEGSEGRNIYKELTEAIARSDAAKATATGKSEISQGFTYHQNQVTNISEFIGGRFGEIKTSVIDAIKNDPSIYRSLSGIIHDAKFAEKATEILWGKKSPIRKILKEQLFDHIQKELGITWTDKQLAESLDGIMKDLTESDWGTLFKDIAEDTGDTNWSKTFETDAKRIPAETRVKQGQAAVDRVKDLETKKQGIEEGISEKERTPLTPQEKRKLTQDLNKNLPPKRMDTLKQNTKVLNKYLVARKDVMNKNLSIGQFQQEMTELFDSELRDFDDDLLSSFNETLSTDISHLQKVLGATADEDKALLKETEKDLATASYDKQTAANLLTSSIQQSQRETAIVETLINPVMKQVEHELLSRQLMSIRYMTNQLRVGAEMLKNPNYADEVIISLYTMTPYKIAGSGTNIENISKDYVQYIEQVFDVLRNKKKGTTAMNKALAGGVDLYEYATMPSNRESIYEALLWLDSYDNIAAAKEAGASLNDSDFIIAQAIKDKEAQLLERNRGVGSNKLNIGSRENPAKIRDYAYRIENKDITETEGLATEANHVSNRLYEMSKAGGPNASELEDKSACIRQIAKSLLRLDGGGKFQSRLGHFSFVNHDLDKMFPQSGMPKQSMNLIRDLLIDRDWRKLTDMSLDDLQEAANTVKHTMDVLMGTDNKSGWASHMLVGSSKIVDAVNGTYSRYVEDAQTRIVYKDIPTAVKAQKMFGYDSLTEQLHHDFGNLQKEYAVLSKVGYDPIGFAKSCLDMHRGYISNLTEKGYFKSEEARKSMTISDGKQKFILSCAKLATGLDDTPASIGTRIAKILGNFATSPLLVNAGIKSLTDYSYANQWFVQNGLMNCSDIGMWLNGVDMARKMFMENPELKRICYYNTALTKDKFLDYLTNGDASARARGLAKDAPLMNRIEQASSTWSDLFINKIGHVEPITNINRSAASLNIMRSLGSEDINISYDDLLKKYGPKRGARLQELLRRHGIDAEDWDFLRQNCVKELGEHVKELGGDHAGVIEPGFKMFFPESVTSISEKKLENELKRRGVKNPSAKDIADFRQIQLEKAMTLIQASADEMITLPTARTTAALSLGLSANSGMGAALNAFLKFKSFGMASNQIHFGRRIANYIDTEDPNVHATLLSKMIGVNGFRADMYGDLLSLMAWLATSEFVMKNVTDVLTGNTQGFFNEKGEFNTKKITDPIVGTLGIMETPVDAVLGFMSSGGTRGGGVSIQAAPLVSSTLKPIKTVTKAMTSGDDFGDAVKKTLASTVEAGANYLGISRAAFIAPLYNEIIGNWIEKQTLGANDYYKRVNRRRREGYQVDWFGQRMGTQSDPFFGVFE